MNEPQYILNILLDAAKIPHLFIDGAIKEGKQIGKPFEVQMPASNMICCTSESNG